MFDKDQFAHSFPNVANCAFEAAGEHRVLDELALAAKLKNPNAAFAADAFAADRDKPGRADKAGKRLVGTIWRFARGFEDVALKRKRNVGLIGAEPSGRSTMWAANHFGIQCLYGGDRLRACR